MKDDILDWDQVERKDIAIAKDVLGLSMQDRQALGLSPPPASELQAPLLAGAEIALAEVLARGGALAPGRAREPYKPSSAVGKAPLRRNR